MPVLEVLARAIRQEKEIKGIQIGKEELKLPVCRWYNHIYTQNNLKISTTTTKKPVRNYKL